MAWEDNDSTNSDGRKPGEPHPDAQRNYDMWRNTYSAMASTGGYEQVYDRTRSTGKYYKVKIGNEVREEEEKIIEEPICVRLYWKDENDNNMGSAISFHQSNGKFLAEVAKF